MREERGDDKLDRLWLKLSDWGTSYVTRDRHTVCRLQLDDGLFPFLLFSSHPGASIVFSRDPSYDESLVIREGF